MKFVIAALLCVASLTNAKLNEKTRKLTASNAGAYHTDAFEQLAEKYAMGKPETRLDLMVDISEIVADYCPPSDKICRSAAYKATLKQFKSGSPNSKDIVYPENFDDRVKEGINQGFDVIASMDNTNLKEKVEELKLIEKKISNLSEVDPMNQLIGVASLSTGQESATYWYNVYNDESHSLRGIQFTKNGSGRRLEDDDEDYVWQDFFPLNMNLVVAADVAGAVEHSIEAVEESPQLVFDFAGLILSWIAGSIPASAAMIFTPKPPMPPPLPPGFVPGLPYPVPPFENDSNDTPDEPRPPGPNPRPPPGPGANPRPPPPEFVPRPPPPPNSGD